tara:strand:+ start:163 stop:573 length:411 start_codon:yes stop_codon:yes gene_type:complete
MKAGSDHRPVEVVLGLIQDSEGRVLLGRRPDGSHMAGYWELPGGKRNPNESPKQTLCRELYEELSIRVLSATFFMVLSHKYSEREVRLEVWHVESYKGDPIGHEGQTLRWSLPNEFRKLPILPADEPLIDILLERD